MFDVILITVLLCACGATLFLLFGRKKKHQNINHLLQDIDERLYYSGLQIAKDLRMSRYSSFEIVSLFIRQLERVNPAINAISGRRYEQALKEAMLADALLETERVKRLRMGHSMEDADSLPMYLGVPLIVKEVFEMTDMPYTAGLMSRKNVIGTINAPVIDRLQCKGGFIIIASGNISEACMWYESSNNVYGTTNNPYCLSSTPGGSSGGNAAIVAALGAPMAVTSDVGGSTRIPSFYCGLFGHKPSGGTIPNNRTIPPVMGLTERFCQLGPCCRHAEDLMPLLEILAGCLQPHEITGMSQWRCGSGSTIHNNVVINEYDPQMNFMVNNTSWTDIEDIDIEDLKVINVMNQPSAMWPVSRRDGELTGAQLKVVEHLKTAGCEVENREFEQLNYAFDIWAAILGDSQHQPFRNVITEGKHGTSAIAELFKYLFSFGSSTDHTLPALGLAVFERLTELNPTQVHRFKLMGQRLKMEIYNALGEEGVMLVPTLPVLAPEHGPLPLLLRFADAGACGIFNVLEFPATAVPLGLSTSSGKPLGIQIVSRHGNDHLTIAVANELSRAGLAKYVQPPKS